MMSIGLTVSSPVLASGGADLLSEKIKTSVSLGWLGGESKEKVYDADEGHKISELKWQIRNTAIIKGDISWDVLNWLTLNANGWTSLASSGSGGMDDYDWLIPEQSDWTHWSTHPNTRLNHANEFDINVKGWFLNQPEYRLGAVLGYQQTRFSWTSFGGSYSYFNGQKTGEIPRNQRVIGYKQQFTVPYIGISGIYRYQNLEFTGGLKFSPWVVAKDNDEHYSRYITFRDKTRNSKYYAATFDVGYYVTADAKIYTELTLDKYAEGRGGSQMIDTKTGESYQISGDVAGIENINYSVSVGLQYRF